MAGTYVRRLYEVVLEGVRGGVGVRRGRAVVLVEGVSSFGSA